MTFVHNNNSVAHPEKFGQFAAHNDDSFSSICKFIDQQIDSIIFIPKTLELLNPILSILPIQLLAYHIAVLKGIDVDKPRNLEKFVV